MEKTQNYTISDISPNKDYKEHFRESTMQDNTQFAFQRQGSHILNYLLKQLLIAFPWSNHENITVLHVLIYTLVLNNPNLRESWLKS